MKPDIASFLRGERPGPPLLFAVSGVLIALAVLFSACGGDDDPEPAGGGGAAPANTPTDGAGNANGATDGNGDGNGGNGNGNGGGTGGAGSDLLQGLTQAGQAFAGLDRYQVEFRVETPGVDAQAGDLLVDGENFQIDLGEFQAIVADGSTYVNVGGTWQEIPGAAGAGALSSSPLSPDDIARSIGNLTALDTSGVEVVERGLVDVPGGACTAYSVQVEGQPGIITYCLREGSDQLAQVITADGAGTTVTLTFTYDDVQVTAP